MSSIEITAAELVEPPEQPEPAGRPLPWPLRLGAHLENAILIFALAMMVLLPLLESARRVHFLKTILDAIHLRVESSSSFVQQGSLIVGLLGGAVAARQNRLLSLATSSMLPKGWPRRTAHLFSGAAGAVVAGFLALASYHFVKEVTFAEGDRLAYNIPVWIIQIVMPIGFGLIALHLLWFSAPTWTGRGVSLLIAALITCFFIFKTYHPATDLDEQSTATIAICLIVLLLAAALGAPIFAMLGGAALILFWGSGQTIDSIPLDHASLVTNPTLPTIPLFTLAGYFLAEGGASKRLVRVFSSLFEHIRGGPALVTVLLCAFFTSFTGASGVTILALGGVLMPILLHARYSERAALGLLTGAGSLGMLFPPCLPLILYAIIAGQQQASSGMSSAVPVTIQSIFLGAIVPGILLLVMTGILGVLMGPRRAMIGAVPAGTGADSPGPAEPAPPFSLREVLVALWQAKWELLMPVVALWSLLSGWATPVEAAAFTAFYAFLTQTIFWRDLTFRKGVPHVMVECGLVIGGVLLILGVAQGFTDYLVIAQIPQHAADWVTSSVHSPHLFLLLLNLFLLVVGGLMDIYPAIIVVVPLIVPIGEKFGVNPIHLGVIFLANLELGFMMPPVGLNLLLSSYRFNKPMPQVIRAILPILAIQLVGVLLITYVPPLTTLLPRLFGH